MNWYKIILAQECIPINSDDYDCDIDIEGQAWQLAQESNINILSNKELTEVVVLDKKVVGALWTSWNLAEEEFSFDIIVNPNYQRQGIGSQLIDSAILQFYNQSDMFKNPKIIVEVVNPNMVRALEKKGFHKEKIMNDRIIMTL